jgi:putative transcriptional regulator
MDEFDFPAPEDSWKGENDESEDHGSENPSGKSLGSSGGSGQKSEQRRESARLNSLAGSLLVAHPELMDPNFRRTVLLLSEHDKETGAFGLILNRPTGQTVGQLLAGQALGKLKRVPVFMGGPVASDQMIFASFQWDPVLGRMECGHHLSMEEAEECLSRENTVLRAYIGYSGWSRGQLEGELEQRSWLVAQALPQMLDLRNAAGLWRESVIPLGPVFRLQAEAPEELGLN